MNTIYRTPAYGTSPEPKPKLPLHLRVMLWFSSFQIVRQYFGGHWERYRIWGHETFQTRSLYGRVVSWGRWRPVKQCIAKTRTIEALGKASLGFECEHWPEEDIYQASDRNVLLSKAVDHFNIPTPATANEVIDWLMLRMKARDRGAHIAYEFLRKYRRWPE